MNTTYYYDDIPVVTLKLDEDTKVLKIISDYRCTIVNNEDEHNSVDSKEE